MTFDRQEGLGKRIVRAGIAVLIGQAIFKLASVLQAMVMAPLVDRRTYDVAYAFAFENCVFTFFMIGEEVIAPSFLPVFMREKDSKGETAAWHFASIVLTLQTVVLLAAALFIMFFPDAIIHLVTAWDANTDPEKIALARQSLRWVAPALIGLSLGSTTYMILNGYKRFFLAAFGDASWKFCILLAVWLGMGKYGLDHRALLLGILVGSVAKVATHLAGLRREWCHFRLSLAVRNPALGQMFVLMLPLIAGIIFAKIRDVYNNVTVLTYFETEGLLMANSFGRKLSLTVGWLVPYALSVAMFPFFCEMVDRNEKEKFGQVLTSSARMLLAVFIPLALICAALAKPVVSLLFERGKFTAEIAHWTAVSTACYCLLIPAQALEYLLMKAFFAHCRMVVIIVAGLVFSALSMLISYAGVHWFGTHGVYALVLVALSLSITRILKSVALVVLLKRNVPCFPARETWIFLGRALLVGLFSAGTSYSSILMCDVVLPELRWLATVPPKLILFAKLILAGILSLAGFLISAKLIRLGEPFFMMREARAWIRSKHRPSITETGANLD